MAIRTPHAAAIAGILLLATSPAPAASFRPIDRGTEWGYAQAWSIARNGAAAAGYGSSSLAGTEAFLWTPYWGLQGLGLLPGTRHSFGTGISADGSAVAGYTETSTYARQAFRWTAGGGMVGLGFLPGGVVSVANGISADGAVVAGYGNSATQRTEAFRWTADGGMIGLGSLPVGNFSLAKAVSGDGSTVVGHSLTAADSQAQAFRWTEGTGMVGLGFIPGGGYTTRATAVSTDGSVVVGHGAVGPPGPFPTGHTEAFRWTIDGGMVGLGLLPGGTFTEAYGVSGDGSVVVGHANSNYYDTAFIWTQESGMQSLLDVLVARGVSGLTGWRLINAVAVSEDGQHVVAFGFDPQLRSKVIIASLVPIPSTLFLFPIAFATLWSRLARRCATTRPGTSA